MHQIPVRVLVPETQRHETGRMVQRARQAWGECRHSFSRNESIRQVGPAVADPAEREPAAQAGAHDFRVRREAIVHL